MYQNAFENGLIVHERYLSINELSTAVQWSNDFQAHVQPNEAQIQPNEAQIQPNEAQIQPNEAQIQPNKEQIQPIVIEAQIQPNEAQIQPKYGSNSAQ
jgi:DNA replication initiation complex subunit (GINS family)